MRKAHREEREHNHCKASLANKTLEADGLRREQKTCKENVALIQENNRLLRKEIDELPDATGRALWVTALVNSALCGVAYAVDREHGPVVCLYTAPIAGIGWTYYAKRLFFD